MQIKDISNMPVMKGRCLTCPFGEADGKENDPVLAARIKAQVLTRASQICHHPALHGKEQTHLCRGARDFQLEIFHRLGVIDTPTDASWNVKLSQLKQNTSTSSDNRSVTS